MTTSSQDKINENIANVANDFTHTIFDFDTDYAQTLIDALVDKNILATGLPPKAFMFDGRVYGKVGVPLHKFTTIDMTLFDEAYDAVTKVDQIKKDRDKCYSACHAILSSPEDKRRWADTLVFFPRLLVKTCHNHKTLLDWLDNRISPLDYDLKHKLQFRIAEVERACKLYLPNRLLMS